MKPLSDLIRWREDVGRSLLNLDFRAEGEHPFSFQMSPILIGNSVRVVHNVHSPGYTFRDRELLRDGNDCLAIVYPLRGTLSFSQEGGGMLRRSGDAKLLVSNKPGHLGAKSACNYMSIIFQPADLPSGLDIERLARSPWPANTPALRLLRSYIDALNGTFIQPGTELSHVTQQHVLDLVGIAASEHSQSDPADLIAASTIGEARLRIACEDLARSFRDPALTEESIAIRQGISTRQLQRIFECAGMTFTSQLQELRLKAAFDTLSDLAAAKLSIAEVALASGFSDISHFNRLFRRRYGETPSDVRRRSVLSPPTA